MNDRHRKRMEYVRKRIQDQRMLKDAQVQNGPQYQVFQNEITNLTDELREWELKIDQIDRLEAEIATVHGQAQAAAQDSLYAAGNWWRLATVCGLIGALLLALSLRWSLGPLPPRTGAVLLALAGGAVFMSTRACTSARNVVAQANLQLAPVREQRGQLIPRSHPPIKPCTGRVC